MPRHYLGIDVGTTAVKALVVDEAGAVVAEAESPLGVSVPGPGWAEQDPHDWWEGTVKDGPGCLRSSRYAGGRVDWAVRPDAQLGAAG